MAKQPRTRAEAAVDYGLTAMLLIGLLLFGRWFVGTIGGELDPGALIVALALIVVSSGIKLLK